MHLSIATVVQTGSQFEAPASVTYLLKATVTDENLGTLMGNILLPSLAQTGVDLLPHFQCWPSQHHNCIAIAKVKSVTVALLKPM